MKILIPTLHFFTTAALTLAFAAGSRADTITLADGKTLENVTVVNETLKEVSFKQEGKSKTIPSETVASVEYVKKPKLVDQADSSAKDGDIGGAIDSFETYVSGLIEGKGKEPMLWAPGYAMQRLIELSASVGDTEGVVVAADRLIKNAPESRYLPAAYLSKATALADDKKNKEALAAIADLRSLINTKELGQRWKLEADLAEVLADASLAGSKRRARVIEISGLAGKDYPMVANRARVAEGESYTEGETKDFTKAKALFQQIAADPKADKPTLAGAYTGLGDCLFAQALDLQKANKDANEAFKSAVDTYMKVVVLFPEQVRYRAKSMFLAGRAFEFIGDDVSKARARQLYRSVIREFKQSSWAEDAKKQMGG
ncbi:MAG: hypothetical protein ABI054_13385 [Planctomycetota bacterium]